MTSMRCLFNSSYRLASVLRLDTGLIQLNSARSLLNVPRVDSHRELRRFSSSAYTWASNYGGQRTRGKKSRSRFEEDPTSVYVSNLPLDLDKASLAQAFAEFGSVASSRLLHREDGESLGVGFVEFDSAESVEKALASHEEKTIDGQSIVIKPAKRRSNEERRKTSFAKDMTPADPSSTIYVSNLTPHTTSEDLLNVFEQISPVKDVRVPYNIVNGEKLSKGFGFVEFEDAEAAKEVIDNPEPPELHGQYLTLGFAKSRRTFARSEEDSD